VLNIVIFVTQFTIQNQLHI